MTRRTITSNKKSAVVQPHAAMVLALIVSAAISPCVDAFSTPTSMGDSPFMKTVKASATNSPMINLHQNLHKGIHTSTKKNRQTKTNLNMVAASGPAAFAGVITGGLIGGALHAIAGPDHLAALLPRCCGQRWFRAGRIGALWGMGHGVSATLLGLTAFGLKNRMSSMKGINGLLHGASSAMEIAVGASLILIGILGIKEAREWEEEIEVSPQSLSAAAADAGVKTAQKRAVVFNGLLHGFSWDGAPSLAPALAVATWRGSISFLLSYAVGTIGAMTLTTTLIGESTRRAGEILDRPDVPQKLSFFSSILAIGVGAFWCFLAFK